MKKLISFCLTLVLLAGLVCVIIPASAEAEYAVGDLPYKTANSRSDIVISSGENLSFYDDFIVKDNIESYTGENLISASSWKLQAGTASTTEYNSVTLNEDVNYSYSKSGKSLKLTYNKKGNAYVILPSGQRRDNCHRLASQKNITVNAEYSETAAIAFWVKTDKPVYLVMRCLDNSSSNSNQFLISDEILLNAGEHIVEIPISSLSVTNSGYKKGNGNTSGQLKLYYPEFVVRGTEFTDGETEHDIYIDNLGYYNISTNGTEKAVHSNNGITKLPIEGYSNTESNPKRVNKGNCIWQVLDNGSTSAISVEENSTNTYGGSGQSVKYTSEALNTGNIYHTVKTNEVIDTKNREGEYLGQDATLAIWIKASRAINVYAVAGDGKEDGSNFYKTDKTYLLPAGESVLRIPVSDFWTDNPLPGATCDRTFNWQTLKALRLYFNSATTDNTDSGITLYIDNIAIEAPVIGDANDDGRIDIRDLVSISDYIGNSEDKELVIFDVGGTAVNEKGYPVADGTVDGNDIAVMIKKLLGTGKLAIEKYKG